MRTVFADAWYLLALLNARDTGHSRAIAFTKTWTGLLVTTTWVLTELGDGLARSPRDRDAFLSTVADLRTDPDVIIVPTTDQLWEKGRVLYERRADKKWSLTDCISFVVMQERGIIEVLTADHHFEQAGFVALLK